MKLRKMLVVCGLTIATVLSGCSLTPASKEEADKTTNVVESGTQDTANEVVPEGTVDVVDTNAADTENVEDGGEGLSESSDFNALLAYRDVLEAAPALTGDRPEVEDLTLTPEESKALFGEHVDYYTLTDLDRNGIPELITLSVVNVAWVTTSIYTYVDGNVALVEAYEQTSTAEGTYTSFICNDGHFHSYWRGNTPEGDMEENIAYVLEGSSMVQVDCAMGLDDTGAEFIANYPENLDLVLQY